MSANIINEVLIPFFFYYFVTDVIVLRCSQAEEVWRSSGFRDYFSPYVFGMQSNFLASSTWSTDAFVLGYVLVYLVGSK